MPRRRQSSFTRFRKTLVKRFAKARRQAARSGKRLQRTAQRTQRRLTSRAKRKAATTSRRLKRATAKAVKEASRTRKSLTRTAKAAGRQLRKWNRQRKARRREIERKRRSAARIQKREFGRLVLVGSQLPEEFEKGVRATDPGASRPGEPPRMRSGKGRQSITIEIRMKGRKPEGRVYVDKKVAPYMAMWEFRQDGKQRPFLKPSVMNHLSEYGQTVVQEVKKTATGPKQKARVR